MINAFESLVRLNPDGVFFTFVARDGSEHSCTYRQARLTAAAIARRLRSKGVGRGDCVSVDLPNCPEFIFLALAAGYGAFSLVVLNNRLTSAEKLSRLFDLESSGIRVACRIDEARAETLMDHVADDLAGVSRLQSGRRVIMSAERDAVFEATHFAERESHLFNDQERALVLFTSGTTGKPKAVPSTWRMLTAAAESSNAVLSMRGRGMWQVALPLYHIGGFEQVVRSITNRTPFRLYARFDAARILKDAARVGFTHISVVDKMLQDMLAVEGGGPALAAYRCILLGGGALNPATIARAHEAGLRLYASYGMTETCSQIANSLIDGSFTGGMELLPGYQARIVEPDGRGFGRLAVRGPGVLSNYLNARAAFTADGFFLTGDVAALHEGKIYVKERTTDMFVSGGENVYPAEIADKLMAIPGVADAYVFGAPDPVWGRRPVAFIERTSETPARGDRDQAFDRLSPVKTARFSREVIKPQVRRHVSKPLVPSRPSDREFVASVHSQLEGVLSKLYRPKQIFVMESLPRQGIGKIDRAAIERIYSECLDVRRVILHRVRIPFKKPFVTAKATLEFRESVIVEVIDAKGRVGLGECVAFSSDWYLPETIEQDIEVLRGTRAPKVIGEVFLHPREVSAAFTSISGMERFPLACGAIEPALWDLYGKIVGKPLGRLLAEEYDVIERAAHRERVHGKTRASFGNAREAAVSAGAVVGMGSVEETLDSVSRCVEAGYCRVKLKVAPGSLGVVRMIRQKYPHLFITLDANQSFTDRSIAELRALDPLNVAWIEEPIDLTPCGGSTARAFARLAALQRTIATPICLDESFVNEREAYQALSYPELRCFAVKVAKFGGVEAALKFIFAARSCGREVWMGGMYDTGISKRMHAAFQTLDEVVMPGDIGSTSRYFDVDVTMPPYTAERGKVTLNRAGYEFGLGCSLCPEAISSVQTDRIVIE